MKGAFPVSGEEVQFAKMTEAEKGKEDGGCNLRLLVVKKHFANLGALDVLVLVLRSEIGIPQLYLPIFHGEREELPSR